MEGFHESADAFRERQDLQGVNVGAESEASFDGGVSDTELPLTPDSAVDANPDGYQNLNGALLDSAMDADYRARIYGTGSEEAFHDPTVPPVDEQGAYTMLGMYKPIQIDEPGSPFGNSPVGEATAPLFARQDFAADERRRHDERNNKGGQQ